jgi:Protein of unknown function (DUF1761)
MEELKISMLAIGIAVVAHFVFGFLWYTPIFGKVWAKEMGFPSEYSDEEKKAMMSTMMKGMVVMLIGNFFMAYVLSHNMAAWDFVPGMEEMGKTGQAMNAAIFTWLGFFLPTDIGSIFWEKKSVKLFAINTGYHLFALILVAMIIVYVR